jgi:gluconate 5-dehydrogenase
MNDLTGKHVIITGASKGLGKSVASYLYSQGASLTLLSRHLPELEKEFGGLDQKRILLLETDITEEKNIEVAVKQSIAKFSTIDVLINNAGVFTDKPIDKISGVDFDRLMNTNVKGMFLMSKTIVPLMKKQHKGYIVNVGSKISHNTNVSANKTLYAVSKYSVEGFSLALNNELKPFGIRVTCIMPGTLKTFFSFKSSKYLKPEKVAQILHFMISQEDVDFESIVFKSIKQQI